MEFRNFNGYKALFGVIIAAAAIAIVGFVIYKHATTESSQSQSSPSQNQSQNPKQQNKNQSQQPKQQNKNQSQQPNQQNKNQSQKSNQNKNQNPNFNQQSQNQSESESDNQPLPNQNPNQPIGEKTYSFFKTSNQKFINFDNEARQEIITKFKLEPPLTNDDRFKNLSGNELRKIEEQIIDIIMLDVFDTVTNNPSYYKKLSLSEQIKQACSTSAFKNMARVHIESVDVIEIPYRAISFFSEIGIFNLINCGITEITEKLSTFLPAKIDEVHLGYNRLRKIPDARDLNISIMDLDNNKGIEIDEDGLNNLSSVDLMIDLSNCSLTKDNIKMIDSYSKNNKLVAQILYSLS